MSGCRKFLIFHLIISYFYTFFFSHFGAANTINVNPADGRFPQGEPASITDFPYQLSMECVANTKFKHCCGASVINNYWLLTAAHCVDGKPQKNIRIRSGTSYRETNGELHEVLKTIIHPQYNTTNLDFDVAVVKVTNPFRYSDSIKPIALAHSPPAAGTPVVVTGWGLLKCRDKGSSQLHKAVLNVVDRNECLAEYAGITRVTPSMICAGDPQGGKDSCHGDSGGPLVADGQLVGVVSWGIPCIVRGYLDVYADVAYLRNWILSTIEIN